MYRIFKNIESADLINDTNINIAKKTNSKQHIPFYLIRKK